MRHFVERNLDASLNRVAEGLRALMDLFRYGLDDGDAAARLKALRHELIRELASTGASAAAWLEARDSQADVGRPSESTSHHGAYRDELDLFEANCRRVQEGLRSIEETYRLTDLPKARISENLRYRLYDLEKAVFPALLARSHRGKMNFDLYVVTDRKIAGDRTLAWVVREAIRGGAGCIQLREKSADIRAFLALAGELRRLTREEGVTFIINDSLEVALEVEADGVHLGQEDLPLEVARRLAGGRLLIGISTHNKEQALSAEAGGAGYINLGPLFPTETKGVPVTPVSVELVREMAPVLKVPFTTMGGIHLENVAEVVLAGADRVAVVSEVMGAPDPREAAKRMVSAIREAKEMREENRER